MAALSDVRLAVFDFDGTLCAGNSLHLAMRHLALERGKFLPMTLTAVRRKFRLTGSREFKEQVLAPLRGMSAAQLGELGTEVYLQRIKPLLRPAGLAALDRAREAGERVILLTGAFDFLIAPFVTEHRFESVVCCRTERAAGFCTGRILGRELLGSEKPEALRTALGAEVRVDWEASSAYTDDLRDYPLLELFGHRYLVVPHGDTAVPPKGVTPLVWADPTGS